MKAVVYNNYGSPNKVLQIKEIPIPTPSKNKLLIEVYATTVNRTDCAQLRAKPFIMRFFTGLFKPRRTILGTAFSGKIKAMGSDVSLFQIGDNVFGFDDNGLSSYAQYMTISESKAISKIPVNINYAQAAASTEGLHYAYNFINKVNLKKEQWVLVNGATGSIGSAAVQLLKYFGLKIMAVCNTKSLQLVQSLGANEVIDYSKDDFTKGSKEYDFIFDAVGKSTFTKCKSLLKDGGIYISSEPGAWGQNIFFALFTPIYSNKIVKFPIPTKIKKSVSLTYELMDKGEYMPVIDKQYPLEEITEAFSYVETGEKIGNVVILVKPQACVNSSV